MKKINLADKLSQFHDHWNPRIISELNGQHVKLAKLQDEFVWHSHVEEDELFFVISGHLEIQFRDKSVFLNPGEMITIPRGVEHRPVAKEEVHVLLFEPASIVNTGNENESELTRSKLEWI
jgi:mannose-6-phosphate isomerase-like protein (cupin superfamily)